MPTLTTSPRQTCADRNARSAPDRQYLNAADRLMLVGHECLRKIGHGGFHCQTHVWLRGRVDVNDLTQALRRLNQRFPVITSRLVSSDDSRGPCWKFRDDAEVKLIEADLPASDPAAVWSYAERLYTLPLDHDKMDPIMFHLLHLPDGRDVFMVHFGHALMDGKGPELTLREINACFASEEDPESIQSDPYSGEDEMAGHLYRFPLMRRARAAMRVVKEHIRLPVRSLTLVSHLPADWVIKPVRILVRTLDENQTEVLTRRVKQLCGFANLSPAILGSTFRAVSQMTQGQQSKRTCFQTDLPLNLRPPGRFDPVFRNFMSFIQMRAMGDELADRDDLVRTLNARMRDQIKRQIDLGNLQMMAIMSQHTWALRRHILDRAKKHPLTLAFGFLGPVLQGLDEFCGQKVDWIYSLNPAISPPGVTLQVNQFGGRINLILTYISATIPESLANAFLDTIIDDMLKP